MRPPEDFSTASSAWLHASEWRGFSIAHYDP
jgi:hypothetical protein